MSNRYGPRIVTDGLVLCLDAADRNSYPLSGDTWYDLSGNEKQITFDTNYVSYGSNNNGFFSFSGNASSYAQIQTSDYAFVSSFSFGVWVKALASASWKRIIDYSHFGTPRNGWFLGFYGSTGKYEFRLDQIGNGDGSVVSNVINLNQWYYITCVYDHINNTGALYENTILVDSQSTSGTETYASVSKLGIAARLNPSPVENFQGHISNIAIYNKALSASEVLQNYNATKGRFGL